MVEDGVHMMAFGDRLSVASWWESKRLQKKQTALQRMNRELRYSRDGVEARKRTRRSGGWRKLL